MRYNFMNDKRFNIAFEKAKDVLTSLNLQNDDIIETQQLVSIVSKLTNTKIIVKDIDFKTVSPDCVYGAMMCVTKDDKGQKTALILLNSNDKIDNKFRRFSLAHELGHLITGKYNIANDKNSFTLSSHIDYNLNTISETDYNNSEYLLNEQIANIFALEVLIPDKLLDNLILTSDKKTLDDIAEHFDVSRAAILSKIALMP